MSDEYLKACREGVKGAVEQYLAAGGDPDAADGDGGTGLMGRRSGAIWTLCAQCSGRGGTPIGKTGMATRR